MTAMTAPRHQVASATAQLRAVADGVVGVSVWSMDASETAATLVELTRLEAQVVELRARVAAHADELRVGTEVGATSTANWLAHYTKTTRPVAAGVVRLGYDLAVRDRVRDALAAGDLGVDQARVVLRAVQALPDDLDPDLVVQAEEHLVAQAREWDARALKRLGDRILDVIAPEVADAHEAKLLEREEHQAVQACRLTMSDDGHGTTHGRFTLPTAQGAMLRKMLLAIAAPKHQAATHGPGWSCDPVRSGWAGRSASSSNASPPRCSRRSAAPTRPSWSPCPTSHWWVRSSRPVSSTPARPSAPARPADWRAPPGSSPPSWAATPRSSTSAAPAASTPSPSASPSASATAAAPPKDATAHLRCATPTTTSPGAKAGAPTPTTDASCAPDTTPTPTTPPTR